MILLLIFLAIVVAGMAVFYFALLFSLHSEAPFVPTGRRDMRRILEIAKIKAGEVVYDLGSGDGRVVREAARRGAKAVGIEQSHMLACWARMIAQLPRSAGTPLRSTLGLAHSKMDILPIPRSSSPPVDHYRRWRLLRGAAGLLRGIPAGRFFPPKFIRGDFLKKDLGDADVIFCYLMPKAMERLKKKFERELKPGARVISRAFPIHGWEPVEVFHFSKRSPKVYLYRITRSVAHGT